MIPPTLRIIITNSDKAYLQFPHTSRCNGFTLENGPQTNIFNRFNLINSIMSLSVSMAAPIKIIRPFKRLISTAFIYANALFVCFNEIWWTNFLKAEFSGVQNISSKRSMMMNNLNKCMWELCKSHIALLFFILQQLN